MKYSQVSGENNQNDAISVASSRRRFRRGGNEELSQPLTVASEVNDLESLGTDSGDPYFVFRRDLQTKLEQVDESLADYLRIIHETVSRSYFLMIFLYEYSNIPH